MSRHIQTPRPRRKARAAGIVAAALIISWGGPAASAYWQTLSGTDGAATADSILSVPAPAASGSAGVASVSWAQGTTAAGRPVSGYTVARYSAATGGTMVAAGGGCAGTITTLTCSEAALPAGTWHYTVTPVLAAWAGGESARSGGVAAGDTTRPDAPGVTAPQSVSLANVASVPISGTAEPGTSVTVTVGDAATPKHTASQVLTAGSNGQWTAANFDLTSFADGTITYMAVAADAAGNVSDPGTATSKKDAEAPRVADVALVNVGSNNNINPGDTVVLKFSEALDPSTICSSWQAGVEPTAQGSNQVLVTVSTNDVLSLTVDGCAPLRVGQIGLIGNYAGTSELAFQGTGIGVSRASSLAWNATTYELTITLGSFTSTSGAASSVNPPSNPTFTPHLGLTDSVGNPLPATTFTSPTKTKF